MKIVCNLVIWALLEMTLSNAYAQEVFNNDNLKTKYEGKLDESIKTLRFGMTDSGWMPFIGTDVQNGLIGISGDLVNDLARDHGIDIEVVKYPNFFALMKALSHGEVDFSSDVVSTKDRRNNFAFTKSYIKSHLGIITHQTKASYSSLEELKGKSIAIEKGFYLEEELSRKYPGIKLIEVESTEDALKMVSARHVDAYVGNLEAANYLINYELLPNLIVTTTLRHQIKPLSFVVRPGYEALVSLLDNYLVRAISNEVIADLRLKWELDYFAQVKSYQKLLKSTIFVISLSVFLFAVMAYFFRKKLLIIDERNKQQAVLKSNERDLVNILDSMYLGLVKIDANHKISYFNKKACRYFRFYSEDIEFLELAERQMERFNLPRTMRIKIYEIVKENLNGEYRLRNEKIVLDVCHLPLKNGEALVTYTDVTQRILDEEALHIEIEKAAASSHVKEKIIANISHKVGTPLHDIIEMLEALDRSELSFEQKRYVGELNGSANLLRTIINDILNFSKLESGEIKLSLKEGSIVDSVEKVCATLAPYALKKGLKFYLDFDPHIASGIWFDATRLELILYNLIDNAIKFTPKGSISLTVELDGECELTQQIFFSVKDTGEGIKPTTLALLFSPPVSSQSNVKQRHVGSGLGLPICEKIAEAMDADLSLDSQGSRGTEVKLTVALKKNLKILDDSLDLTGIKFNLCCMEPYINETVHKYLVGWGATVERYELADLPHKINQFKSDSICIFNDSVWANNLIKSKLFERNCPVINLITEPEISFFQNRDNYIELSTIPLFKSKFEKAIRYLLDLSIINDLETGVGDIQKLEFKEDVITADKLILLVGENDRYREGFLKKLHFLGFKVDIAEGGVQGLRAWENGRYHLVLTACDMPEMDGYDMTRKIRLRESDGVRIPIIALTNIVIEGEHEKCLSAGSDDFITRSASLEQLRTRLGQWIMVEDYVDNDVGAKSTNEKFNLGPDEFALL